MKRIFRLSGLIIFLAIITNSCYKDNKEDLYQNFNQTGCDTTNTGFSEVIQPIFVSNCALSGCHSGTVPESGLDLSTYSDISNIANDGRLEKRITGDPGPIMPPTGSLPQCEIDKILKWVENGAQNN